MSALDTQVERLQAAATERWGDQWVVKVLQFADGDSNSYAIHSHGRGDDGHLVQDQLFLLENGETVVERVTMERRELDNETIEAPSNG